jgi:hypothetical protein
MTILPYPLAQIPGSRAGQECHPGISLEVVMTDMLIRDVPDDVIAALDANARRRAGLAGLAVLHLDKDFDVMAGITGRPVERLSMP